MNHSGKLYEKIVTFGKVAPPAVYRHQDAALFGSILAFLPPPASHLVNHARDVLAPAGNAVVIARIQTHLDLQWMYF